MRSNMGETLVKNGGLRSHTAKCGVSQGHGRRLGLKQSDGPKGDGSCLGNAEAVTTPSLQEGISFVPTQVSIQ